MFVLSGISETKLVGHKELTRDKPIISVEAPDEVFIPLMIGLAIDFDVHVQAGDQVLVGTKLATRKSVYVPIYSPVSGTVKGVVKRMHASGKMQQHIVITNDHQYNSQKIIDIADPDSLTGPEIVDCMKELGLLGLGGAGFPTYLKYKNPEKINTLIINAVECEPYITTDHVSIMGNVEELFDGIEFMRKAADVNDVWIAIKEHKPEMQAALEAEAAKHPGYKVGVVPDRYPYGWERTLVEKFMKKEYDALPLEVGIVVNNSSTAIYLSRGIRKGEGIAKRIVTFSGDSLVNPSNVEVTVGTPVNYVINQIGGYKDVEKVMIINGGPMTGNSVVQDVFAVTTYTNAITVLEHKDKPSMPCIKCGYCIEHCPSGLQPVKLMQAEKSMDVVKIAKLQVVRCVQCGMCSYICPSRIEVTDFVAKARRRALLGKRR